VRQLGRLHCAAAEEPLASGLGGEAQLRYLLSCSVGVERAAWAAVVKLCADVWRHACIALNMSRVFDQDSWGIVELPSSKPHLCATCARHKRLCSLVQVVLR
jgi:hypothetical protein